MRARYTQRLWKALVFSIFATFGMSFSHVSLARATSMDMMGHAANTVQCQSSCLTVLPAEKQDELVIIDDENKEPTLLSRLIGSSRLSLLTVACIVKELFRLSSWRPPDLTLLHGHYADGL